MHIKNRPRKDTFHGSVPQTAKPQKQKLNSEKIERNEREQNTGEMNETAQLRHDKKRWK